MGKKKDREENVESVEDFLDAAKRNLTRKLLRDAADTDRAFKSAAHSLSSMDNRLNGPGNRK